MGLFFPGKLIHEEKVIEKLCNSSEISNRTYIYEHLGNRVWIISGKYGAALAGDEGNGWVIVLEEGDETTLRKHAKNYHPSYRNFFDALQASR